MSSNAAQNKRSGIDLGRFLYPLTTTLAILVVWQILVTVFTIPEYLLPKPTAIFAELVTSSPTLLRHLAPTLRAAVLGYLLAVAVGVPLAVVLDVWPGVFRAVNAVLVAFQVVPKLALAPLFVVWLGFGEGPKVVIAFLVCFFPIVVDGLVGLQSLEPEYEHLLKSMGATRRDIYLKARLPHALPHLFASFKVAATLSVTGAIVAEFVGANAGLGYLLQVANSQLKTTLMFADLVVLSLLGVALYWAIEVIEKRLLWWHFSRHIENP